MTPYCASRFVSVRRTTREVKVGNIGVGADNPIRIQSMTTTSTMDVEATVNQARALVEAGCEIVRITAPNVKSAQALARISRELRNDKIDVPLVADIHFLPAAAMEAAEHVEKVRVNPGNYADKKKFQIREYSDVEYTRELERLYEAFSPLVIRCKKLGRSMRIGTNHGSLSDRIMNRFGDSPLGMVESALEFIRIAESHGYRDIILSMKASNPKVMIQAYRLVVAKMNEENMKYPLHLGVTEAGDGEDGRIKSSIGIGSLLIDGLGDTIRVSLTEDPVYEIPIALALAEKTHKLWDEKTPIPVTLADEGVDPYSFSRREIVATKSTDSIQLGSHTPPRVFIKPGEGSTIQDSLKLLYSLWESHSEGDTPIEGWLIKIESIQEAEEFISEITKIKSIPIPIVLDLAEKPSLETIWLNKLTRSGGTIIPMLTWKYLTENAFQSWIGWCNQNEQALALKINAEELAKNATTFISGKLPYLILTTEKGNTAIHQIGEYRLLNSVMSSLGLQSPIWIRSRKEEYLENKPGFLNDLLETSLLAGSLLTDGFGDILSIESVKNPEKAVSLAYNVLQGTGSRISKTEYVACPSCGRTLFDLQQTTQKIRNSTHQLKGVKIAVMGCIVNGPGEMADADFGYVGGAPGKVNLYIGKDCVEYHVPEKEAVSRLIQMIKQEGKWVDPAPKVISVSQ